LLRSDTAGEKNMKELEYPLDSGYIMKKRKALKRRLLSSEEERIHKRIAVLGGSTTADIVSVLELFLLDSGIEPEFYQCGYAQYRNEALFPSKELEEFAPDIVYLHTSRRNLGFVPSPKMTEEQIGEGLAEEIADFERLWDSLAEKFRCPIIQNNFEQPYYRLLGNSDFSDHRGQVNFTMRMNLAFAERAQKREDLYINDINWLSAACGLEKWSAPEYWYMYKYSLNVSCIPELCLQLAAIIRSVFGRNKKAVALDLDNTLWGGIVGDDGAEDLVIGQESAEAMAFYEWQSYLKALKDIGVLLTVCSKNDEENALAGLNHPEGALRPEDFTVIKANWLPKDKNISDTAEEIGILPEAFVFADDNPAERELVRAQLAGVKVPELTEVTDYIRILDRSEYFEVTSLSEDDLNRSEMYKANAQRKILRTGFESYGDYLKSLEMRGEIRPFSPAYIRRIAQLTNKSNQFNLTSVRYTAAQIEEISKSDKYVHLYGRLSDKFGDNGVVSVIIGETDAEDPKMLDILLWLMSCRVLKRDMELAMLDGLVKAARERGFEKLTGIYIPTSKNKMVRELYPGVLGFSPVPSRLEGADMWELDIRKYKNKNTVIEITY